MWLLWEGQLTLIRSASRTGKFYSWVKKYFLLTRCSLSSLSGICDGSAKMCQEILGEYHFWGVSMIRIPTRGGAHTAHTVHLSVPNKCQRQIQLFFHFFQSDFIEGHCTQKKKVWTVSHTLAASPMSKRSEAKD